MSLADELFDLTRTALTTCSDQQRTIYQLVHGITETGTHEPVSLEQAARTINLSRSAARWHLAMAEVAVYKLIAQTLIAQRQQDTMHELPGTHTVAEAISCGLSIRTRSKQAYTNIDLGEGSTQFIRASRIGPAESRTARYQEIHQAHTRTDT